jgi:hypothetical protein
MIGSFPERRFSAARDRGGVGAHWWQAVNLPTRVELLATPPYQRHAPQAKPAARSSEHDRRAQRI